MDKVDEMLAQVRELISAAHDVVRTIRALHEQGKLSKAAMLRLNDPCAKLSRAVLAASQAIVAANLDDEQRYLQYRLDDERRYLQARAEGFHAGVFHE